MSYIVKQNTGKEVLVLCNPVVKGNFSLLYEENFTNKDHVYIGGALYAPMKFATKEQAEQFVENKVKGIFQIKEFYVEEVK